MIRTIFFALLPILLVCCQSATAPAVQQPKPIATTATPQKQPVSLTHLVRPPNPQTAHPPVLIILHGVGANERNLYEPLAQYFDPRLLVISVRSPIELRPDAYGWYNVGFSENGVVINAEEEDQGRQQLLKIIDEIINYYEVDPKKVFLLGFSQGAIMSAAAVLSAPEKIRGAVLLSGKVPLAIDKSLAATEAVGKVAVFISHGKQDRVLPILDGQQLQQKMKAAGVKNLVYQEHEGAHQVDGQHFQEVLKWLSALVD